MAGLEGIDASTMDVIDALGGTRWVYDAGDRVAKPLLRHTDFMPVARNEPSGDGFERVVDKVRFGLPVGPRILTNARSDNLASPAWRGLFGKPQHHCLAAVGYVVERDPKTKAAYRIQRRDGTLMVVPGLVARRHYSFASTGNEYDDLGHVQLTADANQHVAQVHGRFVVELDSPAKRDAWMQGGGRSELEWLLAPAPEDRYAMVPIDPDVWTKRDPQAVIPRGQAWVWP